MFATSNVAAEAHFIKYYEKNHGNMVSHKESDNFPAIEPQKHGILKTDKEFKIAVMKKFNELQENWKRHFNKFKNKINEQKGTLTKCPKKN